MVLYDLHQVYGSRCCITAQATWFLSGLGNEGQKFGSYLSKFCCADASLLAYFGVGPVDTFDLVRQNGKLLLWADDDFKGVALDMCCDGTTDDESGFFVIGQRAEYQCRLVLVRAVLTRQFEMQSDDIAGVGCIAFAHAYPLVAGGTEIDFGVNILGLDAVQ